MVRPACHATGDLRCTGRPGVVDRVPGRTTRSASPTGFATTSRTCSAGTVSAANTGRGAALRVWLQRVTATRRCRSSRCSAIRPRATRMVGWSPSSLMAVCGPPPMQPAPAARGRCSAREPLSTPAAECCSPGSRTMADGEEHTTTGHKGCGMVSSPGRLVKKQVAINGRVGAVACGQRRSEQEAVTAIADQLFGDSAAGQTAGSHGSMTTLPQAVADLHRGPQTDPLPRYPPLSTLSGQQRATQPRRPAGIGFRRWPRPGRFDSSFRTSYIASGPKTCRLPGGTASPASGRLRRPGKSLPISGSRHRPFPYSHREP